MTTPEPVTLTADEWARLRAAHPGARPAWSDDQDHPMVAIAHPGTDGWVNADLARVCRPGEGPDQATPRWSAIERAAWAGQIAVAAGADPEPVDLAGPWIELFPLVLVPRDVLDVAPVGVVR